jgi:N-acetylmuramoyl-L-alanine amidase
MKKFTFHLTILLLCLSPLCYSSGVNYSLNLFGKKKKIVVLDAGHGGHDSGAVGKIHKEKDLSLKMILKLGQMITDKYPDIEVVYTRKSDVFLPLYERIGIANKKKADLFISIHCNYIGNAKTKGTETFVMGLHRAAENLAVAQRENEVILMENDYESNYEGYDPNSPIGHIVLSSFQDAYLAQSLEFAARVEKNFDNLSITHSRGVKQAGFAVLRRATMPSVLIESGFISNAEEEERLGSEQGQLQVAKSICDALAVFFNVPAIEDENQIATAKKEETPVKDNPKKIVESPDTIYAAKGPYRIQIAAMKQEVERNAMSHLEKVGQIYVVQENGYFKYQIGDYNDLPNAENARKQLVKLGYNGSFVIEKK